MTRGVQEQQHTLPTELTQQVGNDAGLMVPEGESSKPEEQEKRNAEAEEQENEMINQIIEEITEDEINTMTTRTHTKGEDSVGESVGPTPRERKPEVLEGKSVRPTKTEEYAKTNAK